MVFNSVGNPRGPNCLEYRLPDFAKPGNFGSVLLVARPRESGSVERRRVRFAVGIVYLILVAILVKVGIEHVPQDWWDWISAILHDAGGLFHRLKNRFS